MDDELLRPGNWVMVCTDDRRRRWPARVTECPHQGKVDRIYLLYPDGVWLGYPRDDLEGRISACPPNAIAALECKLMATLL